MQHSAGRGDSATRLGVLSVQCRFSIGSVQDTACFSPGLPQFVTTTAALQLPESHVFAACYHQSPQALCLCLSACNINSVHSSSAHSCHSPCHSYTLFIRTCTLGTDGGNPAVQMQPSLAINKKRSHADIACSTKDVIPQATAIALSAKRRRA